MRTSTQRLTDAQFIRNPALAGAELRVVDGQREWGFFSQAYQLLFSEDWSGKVWYQREVFDFGPEAAILAAPCQLVLAKKSAPGTLFCLTIDSALAARLRESRTPGLFTPGRLPLSPTSAAAMSSFVRELPQSDCPEALEALLLELTTAFAATPPYVQRSADNQRQRHAHFREDSDVAFDLRSLSAQLGTSRFAALRAFKRHFGLPPHSYQLHLRVEQAQSGLRAGLSPARVAVDCGFFDQSHLTRHFKRVLGTTPAQYARAWVPTLARALPR